MARELSKDDLLKLLGANLLKKPRKKRDISEEQKEELRERLARMREKSKETRVEKAKMKKENQDRPTYHSEPDTKALAQREGSASLLNNYEGDSKGSRGAHVPLPDDELFEKKFVNRFDKMDDIMTRLDTRMAEMVDMKKAKREAKALEMQKLKEEAETHKTAPKVEQQPVKLISHPNTIPKAKLPDYRNMIRKKY
jgi:hypothetical protein